MTLKFDPGVFQEKYSTWKNERKELNPDRPQQFLRLTEELHSFIQLSPHGKGEGLSQKFAQRVRKVERDYRLMQCFKQKVSLETGLRDVTAGYCITSKVDPKQGLSYRGIPVSELAFKKPEEVIYLLLNGALPSSVQARQFSHFLQLKAACSEKVCHEIAKLSFELDPMALFCTALTLLGSFEKTDDYQEDCLNLVAQIPHLVAFCINHHAGWGETPCPDASLGYMENFVHMLQIPGKNEGFLLSIIKLFENLHYDHGGGNLSTFVGKAVASGKEHLYGSLVAAMIALDGPSHGRANQEGLQFLQKIQGELGENPTQEQVEEHVRTILKQGGLIYGFGHAVLKVEDPRATLLYDYARTYFPQHPLIRLALLLREAAPKVLKENPKISNPYPNVDAISGALLMVSGFPYPQYYTVLFGLSRCVGIARQIVYERCEAREGKGTPIIRPKYLFKESSG